MLMLNALLTCLLALTLSPFVCCQCFLQHDVPMLSMQLHCLCCFILLVCDHVTLVLEHWVSFTVRWYDSGFAIPLNAANLNEFSCNHRSIQKKNGFRFKFDAEKWERKFFVKKEDRLLAKQNECIKWRYCYGWSTFFFIIAMSVFKQYIESYRFILLLYIRE